MTPDPDRSTAGWRGLAVTAAVAAAVAALFGYAVAVAAGDRLVVGARPVALSALVLGTAAALVLSAGRLFRLLDERGVLTAHQREVLYRLAQLAVVTSALGTVLLGVWNVSARNAILGAGVTSVVVALAARQTLSSIIAGVVIITTDVFRVGDWVKIDARFGRIEQISLFNTRVRSPQGEVHVVPNDEIVARDITNLGTGRYRNDVLVGVDYDTDIERAIAICDETLEALTAEADNHVDGFHPTTVKDFDDSQVTLAVKMWVDEPRPMAINAAQTTVLAALHERFADEGVTIPFPQRTVSDRGAP